MSGELSGGGRARLRWIDLLRGYVIFLGVFLVDLNPWRHHVRGLEWLTFHAPARSGELYYPDIAVPVLLWVMGVSMGISYERRVARYGPARALRHLAARYVGFVAIGLLITLLRSGTVFFETTAGGIEWVGPLPRVRWGVFQAVGLSGLVAVPLLHVGVRGRLAASGLLLALHQGALHSDAGLAYVLASTHGGWVAALLSFPAPVIWGTCIHDALLRDRPGCDLPAFAERHGLGGVLLALAGGLLVAATVLRFLPGFLVDKASVSPTYILLATGYVFLHATASLWLERRGVRNRITWVLEAFGRNALTLYLLAELLSDVKPWAVMGVPGEVGMPLGAAFILLVAVSMRASNITFKL